MTISPSLDERFRAAAAAANLLDVAYDVVPDTPVGTLLIGVTERGVCRISFDAEPEHHLEELARADAAPPLSGPRLGDDAGHVSQSDIDSLFDGDVDAVR